MITYEIWNIVKVPFPFTDKNNAKIRPALVVSQPIFQQETQHVILTMITSAKHSSWPMDIDIEDLNNAGLPIPSVIRLKIFTLDERLLMGHLGVLDNKTKQILQKKWAPYLDFTHLKIKELL